MSVFEYRNYKKYLNDWIDARPNRGRGERSRMARALRCHAAFVSLVLSGDAHFSLEQASLVSRHLEHGEEEEDFFLLLVQHERAGNETLRRYFLDKQKRILDRRMVLQNRLEFKKSLSLEDQAVYFSSWHFAAIHLLLAVPEFQTPAAIARHLRITPKRVTNVLKFLLQAGFAAEKEGKLVPGTVSIHVGNDSALVNRHHANWRMQALQSMERDKKESLHYSSAVTLSRADYGKVRDTLIKAIQDVRAIVKPSQEEALFCYAIDLFEVGGED